MTPDDFFERLRPSLPPAGTPVEDLTDEQRVTVAIFAGVGFTTSFARGALMITTNPCAIVMDDEGRYTVFQSRPEKLQ